MRKAKKFIIIILTFISSFKVMAITNHHEIKFSNITPEDKQVFQEQEVCLEKSDASSERYSLVFETPEQANEFYLQHLNGSKTLVNLYWNNDLVKANQQYDYFDADKTQSICGNLKVMVQLNKNMVAGDYHLNVHLHQ
jgi:hypothetical protein